MNLREQQTVLPFIRGESATAGNCHTDGARYVLHQTAIATVVERDERGRPTLVTFTTGGWHTATTRSRIDAILGALTDNVGASIRAGTVTLVGRFGDGGEYQRRPLDGALAVRIDPDTRTGKVEPLDTFADVVRAAR